MAARKHDDEAMKEALTGRTLAEAAKMLEIHPRNLQRHKARLARQGWSPEHGLSTQYPEGFKMGKVTIQRNAAGDIERTWERMCEDQEKQLIAMQAAIEAMGEEIPRAAPVAFSRIVDRDLLNCYVITDHHLGALAWHEETRGDDYDLAKAEQLLVDWFALAIATAPEAGTGIFAQLGDLLHWDGLDAVTPTSKHVLDADTRFQKLVRVAIRVIRRIVGMLLEKHDRVHVVMAEGNHDLASSVWLREWLTALYENEPRITVDRSPDPYYCYEFGKTALYFHHGHRRKPANVSDVFVAKFRDVFGRTKHSYAHMGHLHHVDVKENNLMIVEQHRTLAAADAYASRGGWMSGRDAKVITYSCEHGEVGRLTISPEMLTRAA
ncbi:winged helix-turn-helix domain-containing protein [Pseudomonas nitroreducens]|uniref:metallophosphoesterase n=1 Tax=Pseudomonas nitroreducens TaxID=46680 RepID=UPI00147550D4|nr:metallophosphoesterase [Pseudomonas nitroreducens]NMZ77495.1 winged helix-turn-helix domain-containing protein [Pseudomonas nitroreducens]